LNNIVYGLVDPRDHTLRYVGKSTSGYKRPKQHFCRYYTHGMPYKNWYVYRWIRKLQREDVKPEIIVLEYCEADDLDFWEIWHIAYWKGLGCRLTNATAGGEGIKGRKWTDAQRKAASERAKGNTNRRGSKISQESKDLISKAQDHKKRQVICVTTGEVFDSKYDVVKKYGIDKGHLMSHLKKEKPRGVLGGLFFRFVDQYDPEKHKPLKVNFSPIVVHDTEGNYINEYPTQAEAKKALGIATTVALKRLIGSEHLSCKGYRFSYKGASE